MALTDEQIEALAKKHGATSYRNRADTQHPAYGFTPTQLVNLMTEFTAEVRKQDTKLVRQMLAGLERADRISGYPNNLDAITAARTRLENT